MGTKVAHAHATKHTLEPSPPPITFQDSLVEEIMGGLENMIAAPARLRRGGGYDV